MTPPVIAAVAAILGALGAYLAAVRKLSGRIGTSDAASLWAESQSIRDDYRHQLLEANKRMDMLEAENAELRAQNAKLTKRVADLFDELRTLRGVRAE